jgi:hypothetical protein
VQVLFDPDINRKLEKFAKAAGLNKSVLIRNWVMERLQQQETPPPKTAL